ncbi:SMEK domain-containing protein [Shewanella oncorhynchi]|uniref:SMEK domain-containing protein n=1 Tax=Shewanella oncorhynchi TaxID=2726434 RepID=UPI003D78BD44
MAHNRKRSVDNISHYLSVLKADLEQHQNLNDLSLNIAAENFFRDVLRFVRKWPDLENLNFFEPCAKSVDLISENQQTIIQVTSTTTSTKLLASLEALRDSKYEDYTIEILYLIDIPNFYDSTKSMVQKEFGVNCDDVILGRKQLLKEIENLDENEIAELEYNYFSDKTMRYTDNAVLQIACKNLVDKMPYTNLYTEKDYELDDTRLKISTNKLDLSVVTYSNLALDYTWIVLGLDEKDLRKLHEFVVKDVYVNAVLEKLHRSGFTVSGISDRSFKSLNRLCAKSELDMTDVIQSVHAKIREDLTIKDFNGIHIPWVILFSFFEICDIGYLEADKHANA